MKGWYTIGIHAPEEVDYTIAVTNSEVSVGILHKGIAMTYHHEASEVDWPTFSYQHHSDESFYIQLEEEYGYAHVMAKSLSTQQEEATLAANL